MKPRFRRADPEKPGAGPRLSFAAPVDRSSPRLSARRREPLPPSGTAHGRHAEDRNNRWRIPHLSCYRARPPPAGLDDPDPRCVTKLRSSFICSSKIIADDQGNILAIASRPGRNVVGLQIRIVDSMAHHAGPPHIARPKSGTRL